MSTTQAQTRAGILPLVPNALTIGRVVLAATFPFVPAHWRVPLLVAALLTEYLDGALARRFGWMSRFGRLLDPIADRCVFAAVSVTLVLDGTLTLWELLALGARDLLFACAVLAYSALGLAAVLRKMRPRFAGKLTTVLQYVALFWALSAGGLPAALWAATLAAGVFAAAQYLAEFQRRRPTQRR